MVDTSILSFPRLNSPFIITTDASKIGCGATLSQTSDGIDLPVSYFSKGFTTGESLKPPIEQELLAIYYAIQHYRPYIYGAKFFIKTDHRPLVHLFFLKNPSSRLTRIRLELEEYDFEVIHIPGKDNVVADALSRIDIEQLKNIGEEIQQIAVTTRSQFRKDQQSKDTITSDEPLLADRPRFIESLNNHELSRLPLLEFDLKNNYYQLTQRRKQIIKICLHIFSTRD